jgi:membrane protein YdbS with pleckstrin-like domain
MERMNLRRIPPSLVDNKQVREESVYLKQLLEQQHYGFAQSFWMMAINRKTGKKTYVRIEVWIRGYPKASHYYALQQYFEKYIPPWQYSLWSYDVNEDDLNLVKGWERW